MKSIPSPHKDLIQVKKKSNFDCLSKQRSLNYLVRKYAELFRHASNFDYSSSLFNYSINDWRIVICEAL